MKHVQAIRGSLARWWSYTAIRLLVGASVSALFLVLALRAVPVDEVWLALGRVNLVWVGVTLLSIVVNTGAKALRWKVLLGKEGNHTRFWEILAALLVGQLLNTFIPTRIGDLSRAYAIGQRGPGMSFVLGTVVLEKLADLIAFGLIILGLLFIIPLPAWLIGPAYEALVVAALIIGGLLLLFRHRFRAGIWTWVTQRFNHRWTAKISHAVRSAFRSGSVLRQPVAVLKLSLLSALVWATAILNNYLMLLAFQIDLPASAAVLLLVGLQIGISLPSLPGTIGVFEYVCVAVLAWFAVERTTALSYGILLHATLMIPSTLVGLLFLVSMRTVWRPPVLPQQIGERTG